MGIGQGNGHVIGSAVAIALLTIQSPCLAINVYLDYGHDTFFSTNATAKAAVEAAAADISTAITTPLAAITSNSYTGTYLSTDVTFDWVYRYDNPTTGSDVTIDPGITAADQVTVFVGARNIQSTDTLGVGGPASVGWSIGASGFPNESSIAVTDAATQSSAVYSRGDGPVISKVQSSFDWDSYSQSYSIDIGSAYGSLWIDLDEDNNNVQDRPTALDSYWHWDHTTEPASGKNDLYSVALHEILHALGVGSADAWNTLSSGSTWNGAEVLAITGSGANLVQGGHIYPNVMSTRLSDGMPQEVVMDPSLDEGKRKELTGLDLAFLRDIGWDTNTSSTALPGDFNGDNTVDAGDLNLVLFGWNGSPDGDWVNWIPTTSIGPAQLNDVLFNWGSTSLIGASSIGASSIGAVPEPSGLAMAMTKLATLAFCRRYLKSTHRSCL